MCHRKHEPAAENNPVEVSGDNMSYSAFVSLPATEVSRVAYIDMDCLKGINDIVGHDAGNYLPAGFVRISSKEVSDKYRTYHYGDNEVIIVAKMGVNAEKLQADIDEFRETWSGRLTEEGNLQGTFLATYLEKWQKILYFSNFPFGAAANQALTNRESSPAEVGRRQERALREAERRMYEAKRLRQVLQEGAKDIVASDISGAGEGRAGGESHARGEDIGKVSRWQRDGITEGELGAEFLRIFRKPDAANKRDNARAAAKRDSARIAAQGISAVKPHRRRKQAKAAEYFARQAIEADKDEWLDIAFRRAAEIDFSMDNYKSAPMMRQSAGFEQNRLAIYECKNKSKKDQGRWERCLSAKQQPQKSGREKHANPSKREPTGTYHRHSEYPAPGKAIRAAERSAGLSAA